jgi:hypothetical protein
MSRKGLEGRQRGSILVQLGASAGVLVLPPLMMSAGIALFGAQTEDRLQISSDQTIVSAVSKFSALIPLSAHSHEVPKSADRPPLHDEFAASTSQPTTTTAASTAVTATAVTATAVTTATAEPAVEADEPSEETKTEAATEPVPFLGPIPVTLVVVRKEPEPEPAEPEEEPTPEPTPPAPPVASIEPVVPHATPKALPAHVAHPHTKPDREETRAPHRIAEKHPHAPAAAPHAPAPHPSATAAHRATAGASVAAKAKPRLQHRADLEN